MIDAKKLLDQFLGAGTSGGYGQSYGARPGQTGLPQRTSGGVMGELQRGLGSVLGGQGAGGASGGQAGMGGMLGDMQRHAATNPMLSGALGGGLASVLLGSKAGRGLSKDAVRLGGLALVAGLAYKAYQNHQATQAGANPAPVSSEIPTAPENTPFVPPPNEAEERARLLVTAMISAAKADGYIDPDEQKRIFDRLGSLDLDAESKAYVMDMLTAPLDLDGIVRKATRPEVATEVYAASLLAIDPDHPAEKAYLQMLAARLGLADDLVTEIHRAAEAARAG